MCNRVYNREMFILISKNSKVLPYIHMRPAMATDIVVPCIGIVDMSGIGLMLIA